MFKQQVIDHNIFPLFSTDFNISSNIIKWDKHRIKLLKKIKVIPRRLIAPMFVLLDITGECNIGCAYCYNKSGRGNQVKMDRGMLFRIAEELVRMKVFSVCVGGGEPTLHPDFVDLIRYFHKNGVLVSSITNGVNLDDETVKEMAHNLAIVQVTLDGPDSEHHDSLRGRGTFNHAIHTIERLKSNNLRQLRIAFTCTSMNIRSFPRMLNLCFEIGANDLRTMTLVPVGRAFESKNLWPTLEDIKLVREQIEDWNHNRKITSRISVEWGSPHEHIRIGLLYGYLLGVNISPEGYYKISPYLPLAFGNARIASLEKAWRLGLGRGWVIPMAKKIFKSINSVDDYAEAYQKIMQNERTQDGFLDLLEMEPHGK